MWERFPQKGINVHILYIYFQPPEARRTMRRNVGGARSKPTTAQATRTLQSPGFDPTAPCYDIEVTSYASMVTITSG